MKRREKPRARRHLMGEQSKAKGVFIEALDQPEAQRSAYLDGACGGDAMLRREVEKLLAALSGQPLLDPAPREGAFRVVADAPPIDVAKLAKDSLLREGPGTRIGPYKLLQLIGEGGFGAVFMAEQEHPVRRRVALKI